jgi:GntR family transcriptional regulator
MDSVDPDSQTPYYQQLYSILRRQIDDGVWRPGDRLPSEAELGQTYDLSRITVRQAFEMLVNDGLIYRRRGSGSYVAVPTIQQGLNRIISFTDDMRQRGLHPGTRVISTRLEAAPADVASRLNIEPGTEVAVLERLRLADGEPMSVEISTLVHSRCPGVLDSDYAVIPLRRALADRYGIHLERAAQEIRAVPADMALALQLGVAMRAPLFYIQRVSFSGEGVPVEYLRVYHRGDRYVLYNELRG